MGQFFHHPKLESFSIPTECSEMLCEEPVMCDVSAVPEATLMQDLAFWKLEKLGRCTTIDVDSNPHSIKKWAEMNILPPKLECDCCFVLGYS